ncbi:MAG TPA: hypothetical protein VFD32_11205 [Dehalococcoidia bacterium]|nr:hypothetical protein [Dehalococcoidia bacterium]
MRLRAAFSTVAIVAALLPLACSEHPAPARTTDATAGTRAAATTAQGTAARTPTATAFPRGNRASTPLPSATTVRPRAASLSFSATLTVSLAEPGGSFTYSYTADGVAVSLDNDGTFASIAPIDASLTVNGNDCTLSLHLVNPQVEIAGSLSDDGSGLRIASLRVSQDDVAGTATCANDPRTGVPDFSGIGAGTTNLSPAAPAAVAFSDGASASLPQPAALDRYPRSVSAVWRGSVRLSLPGN